MIAGFIFNHYEKVDDRSKGFFVGFVEDALVKNVEKRIAIVPISADEFIPFAIGHGFFHDYAAYRKRS